MKDPGVAADASLDAALRRAATLFDARLYFEVHEELEVVWRDAVGETRRVLQGLVQVAVALHHAEAGRRESMRRLLEAGRAKLAPHVPSWHGIQIEALLEDLRMFEAAASGHEAPRGNETPYAPRLIVA